MTDYYFKYVMREYPLWYEEHKNDIVEKNEQIRIKNENIKKLSFLLQDAMVSEFAKTIGYKLEEPSNYLDEADLLNIFLQKHFSFYDYRKVKRDKYPIFCYIGFEKIDFGRIGIYYEDLYINLQQYKSNFIIGDKRENGKNREGFINKNIDNIIYAPEGESFNDRETYYRIKTEFFREALRTNSQEEAHKMLVQKYGRRR